MSKKATDKSATMKALVYHGPERLAWEERPMPAIADSRDAIVHITTTTLCGTDLHILRGDVPTIADGRILGHEGVGLVSEVGAGVLNFKRGDKVLISLITSCGRCSSCRKGMYSHCVSGGWLLGNRIDGTQAEYVRVPCADTGMYHLPPDVDEVAAVMLSCILPTGLECGVLNGRVKPGDTVAIVGAGPVGLATLLAAQLYSPSQIVLIDRNDSRLTVARSFGAVDQVLVDARSMIACVSGSNQVWQKVDRFCRELPSSISSSGDGLIDHHPKDRFLSGEVHEGNFALQRRAERSSRFT